MPIDINVNVKIEGLEELIKVLQGFKFVAHTTEPVVKQEAKVEEPKKETPSKKPAPKKEVKDVTELSDVEVVKAEDIVPEAKEAEVVDPVKEITLDDLRKLGAEISRAGKTQEVLELLRKYEAKGLSSIPEEKRASFYEEASKLVA